MAADSVGIELRQKALMRVRRGGGCAGGHDLTGLISRSHGAPNVRRVAGVQARYAGG
jgi:hypothetical protein